MDEALFDFAHFLADLMAVDGALVVTQALELVGFGAELRFDARGLKSVRHALDLEGEIWANEPLDKCRNKAPRGLPVLQRLPTVSCDSGFAGWVGAVCQKP